jgi:hypothetical protein
MRIHTADCQNRLAATNTYFCALYESALEILKDYPSALIFPEDHWLYSTVTRVDIKNLKKVGVGLVDVNAIPKISNGVFSYNVSQKTTELKNGFDFIRVENLIFDHAMDCITNRSATHNGYYNQNSVYAANVERWIARPIIYDATINEEKEPMIDIPYTVNQTPPGNFNSYSGRRGKSVPRLCTSFGNRAEAIAYASDFFAKNVK